MGGEEEEDAGDEDAEEEDGFSLLDWHLTLTNEILTTVLTLLEAQTSPTNPRMIR